VALEALVTSPSTFAGAVIFEPAMVTVMPWVGEPSEVIRQMRAALAAGKPGKAMAIFARDATGLPAWQARLIGLLTTAIPRYRRLVACVADDLQAMVALGTRLDVYAQIGVPTVLLGGDRTPARIARPLDALEHAMTNAERVVMHKQDHGADLKAPKKVAKIIETFADKVLTPSRE
jgi:pimeloyl-ACP methyl ester carboxylesterase